MNSHLQKAIAAMEAAKPASGFRPETEAEWAALQKAQEELGYAMFLSMGKSDTEARAIARAIHGGAAGRMLMNLAFSEKPRG